MEKELDGRNGGGEERAERELREPKRTKDLKKGIFFSWSQYFKSHRMGLSWFAHGMRHAAILPSPTIRAWDI